MAKKEQDINSKRKTKILIIDDDSVAREALIKLINEGIHFKVCSGAENTAQALNAIEEQQVDLAIVNTFLEDTGCAELTREIKLRRPNLPILTIPTREFLD